MNRKIFLSGRDIASVEKKYSALSEDKWKITVESDDNTQFCMKMKARFPLAAFVNCDNHMGFLKSRYI
jgi:hypothetical protein